MPECLVKSRGTFESEAQHRHAAVAATPALGAAHRKPLFVKAHVLEQVAGILVPAEVVPRQRQPGLAVHPARQGASPL